MSVLQEQASQMIKGLSDDDVSFLIDMIQRFMLPKAGMKAEDFGDDTGRQAFLRLDAARTIVRQYLPEDFDEEKELEEARMER
ncbi:MAG: hypothetical protein J6C19_03715 [Lachnospiraceae bacterium]|nr:hypothetical protein [Lachnospiraceae bacterium]